MEIKMVHQKICGTKESSNKETEKQKRHRHIEKKSQNDSHKFYLISYYIKHKYTKHFHQKAKTGRMETCREAHYKRCTLKTQKG